ncbi:MAG TPA: class I SAM-dependent methyltransferase [Gaiellaceae bacterium]|nr:class I SAM-dependent methyltransferase [Gaiellaceae bacterium]
MSLRSTFDRDPELYDRARPGYPGALFDDLETLLPGERLLEIGCGTGQATRVLAGRGYTVTCVELGASMAELARRRLASFPSVEIVVADFDTWAAKPGSFDGVLAFTSFHWLDPATRFPRIAALLRTGGLLAVVGTHHVLPEDGDDFFVDVQEDYRAAVPEDPASHEGGPPLPDRVEPLELDDSLFERVAHRRYLRDIEYTADEYLAVLATYSGHIALPDEQRANLFERIRRRIEARGRVRKSYLTTLDAARPRRGTGK